MSGSISTQARPGNRRAILPWCSLGISVGLLLTTAWPAGAAESDARQLSELSLEQLLNETVTSVSKKEQKIGDVAAAITSLSGEEIQRSGATSIAEALRWVPGMDVHGVNSSQWAVSTRGFNGIYANKLLVLVDGRAVYTPLFAGVYWDLQRSFLPDVERVEVIRGPGAAIWGANALNGVINVVSRSARDTQGGEVYGGGGDIHQALGGARYGDQIGCNTFYRVFGDYQLNNDYRDASGKSATDRWSSWHGGFRLDNYADEATHLMWQSEVTRTDLDDHASDAYNANLLARWTRQLSDRASYEVQTYYDRTFRNDITRAKSTTDTMDVTLEHRFGLNESNDLIWGCGYRYIHDGVTPTTPTVRLLDRNVDRNLCSAFVQDDYQLLPNRLTFTLGTKLEHNDFTGWEVQPSLRAVFKPVERHSFWAAISRAVRTPSEVEGGNLAAFVFGAPFVGPGGFTYVPLLVGSPHAEAEKLWAYEIGYRSQPNNRINLELNAFYNDYEDILSVGPIFQFVPGAPGSAYMAFDNYQAGHSFGGEAACTFQATEKWRLTASYSLLVGSTHGVPGPSPDPFTGSPRNQVTLRSAYDFSSRCGLDAQARYVDNLLGVPSYITADLRLTYRPTDRCELSLVGQNLLEPYHLEHGKEALVRTSEVPRGFYGKVTWRF